MREFELCKAGGNVVAAVVAVLEKQQEALSGQRPITAKNTTIFPGNGGVAAAADENFESAVKDFDSIAEDVERIVLKTNSLKRGAKIAANNRLVFTTDLDEEEKEEEVNDEGKGNEAPDLSASSRRRDAQKDDSDDQLCISSGDDDDSDEESTSESDDCGEHVIEGLSTIAEEDRVTPSSALSYKGLNEEDSSPDEDESTIKDNHHTTTGLWTPNGSTSSLSTSSSERNKNSASSRRCNNDFQWMQPPTMKEDAGKPPPIGGSRRRPDKDKSSAPGSLDRRRTQPHHHRHERDQKARSSHVLKSPPRLDDFAPCQNWCCSPHENVYFDNFHRRHERHDPQRYGSSPMLMEQRGGGGGGSHPDLYGRHECCMYHMAPPPAAPCCYYGERSYHWPSPTPYFKVKKPGEQDEKFRKLQYEKDNLQLQVQVLSEQIEAQSDKIADLERIVNDKKHLLNETEVKLQHEVLARSSLETQKLELMSILSEMKLQTASLERENYELRQFNNNAKPRQTSTPIHHQSNQSMRMSPSAPQEVKPPKTPPANYKRSIDIHYGSLPRQQFISNGGSISAVDSNANPAKKGVAFAETEKIVIGDGSTNEGPQSPSGLNKNKGIKKIFGKIKRSGSGNLEDLPGAGEFTRGGVRATAGARLGWSEPQLTVKPDKPFAEWDTENICDWLQDLGLDQYIPEARRWIKSGSQLQEASISEIEKELNIKNPLHKKKIQLAVIDTQPNGSSDPFLTLAGQLDTAWVLRWLDDTGLPQHKETFLLNRVDGRVLHRLTVDDLHLLHITSMLHVASIKRGIHVLREHAYDAACLRRRALPEDPVAPSPRVISTWTTHRVMDWLRAVDLAEYAPNLRGAGVHGGVMVYETKFTVELLASLLSIPPEKTLLRRHLQTRFNELLGKEVIQEKREAESTMGYTPLTLSSKLKVAKKSQFSLKRKKSKGEADYGDLVCPLNADKSGELNGSAHNMGMMKMPSLGDEDVCLRVEKVEKKLVRSLPASIANSPVPQRHV